MFINSFWVWMAVVVRVVLKSAFYQSDIFKYSFLGLPSHAKALQG